MFLIASRGLGPATTAAPLQILRYTVQGIGLLLSTWAGKRRVENYEIDKYVYDKQNRTKKLYLFQISPKMHKSKVCEVKVRCVILTCEAANSSHCSSLFFFLFCFRQSADRNNPDPMQLLLHLAKILRAGNDPS